MSDLNVRASAGGAVHRPGRRDWLSGDQPGQTMPLATVYPGSAYLRLTMSRAMISAPTSAPTTNAVTGSMLPVLLSVLGK